MKLPQSLFARLFLWVAALLLVSNATWLAVAYFNGSSARAKETANLAVAMVNLVRAALYAAAPENRGFLLEELSSREGIFLHPANFNDEEVQTLPDDAFTRLVTKQIQKRLGESTRLASSIDGFEGFWVSFRFAPKDEDEYWLGFPITKAPLSFAMHWLIWGVIATFLTLLASFIFARQLANPLKNLAQKVQALGCGEPFTPSNLAVGSREIRELSASFNRMAEDLSAHDKERAIVLAGISHDLRTPLTRLRLEAEMSMVDEESRTNAVHDIEQMEAIIAQFMDYAKSDGGEAPLLLAPTDLFQSLAQRIKERHLADFSFEIATIPTMLLRRASITRAVTNLIDNAFKYGCPPVVLKVFAEQQSLIIEVLDHGKGVKEEEFSRIKRPFARGESARTNTTGTGLGLAIVERITRLHAGNLTFQNLCHGFLVRLQMPLELEQ